MGDDDKKPESVWDYPRPPALDPVREDIVVTFGGRVIARADRALRVLETSHPPTYYLPRDCFVDGALVPAGGSSYCEWKGRAAYFDIVGVGEGGTDGQVAERAAWHYPEPTARFADLVDHVALYPGLMDEVTVDGEVVVAQPGDFYGGWITSAVVGPFKGAPGTLGW